MVNIAYIDEATFEKIYTHRDASASPGSAQFTQWISMYSAQINAYMSVDEDVAAFGDGTNESETIIAVIAELLEDHFQYADLWRRTPEPERNTILKPSIMYARYAGLRMLLDHVKEADDAPAYYYEMSGYYTGGGTEL